MVRDWMSWICSAWERESKEWISWLTSAIYSIKRHSAQKCIARDRDPETNTQGSLLLDTREKVHNEVVKHQNKLSKVVVDSLFKEIQN